MFDRRLRGVRVTVWMWAVALGGSSLSDALFVRAADEPGSASSEVRPNVIVVMTDDQGYGDLGVHGNPVIRTPHLDRMSRESAVLSNFYVSPVCTPTRASLMTGRYNYRTRAIDTFRGRAMADPEETTIAEVLSSHGYATGIFGKWHLGDCYPMRAIDQGFQEALVHRGGGIGQPSDPPGAEGKYTDPTLFHNGEEVARTGYCTDIFFDAAMEWAESKAARRQPFFAYIATNAPHDPVNDVPPNLLEHYQSLNISKASFPEPPGGQPLPEKLSGDHLARLFAMIENIDANVGKLRKWLDALNLTRNTLVVYLTDNGRASPGYNAGLRGRKSEVFDGGIKSPFFACWPGALEPGVASDRIAAHIDLFPTLLEACRLPKSESLKLDGKSVWPLLTRRPGDWPERTLFFQSHRGDVPIAGHNAAVRTQRWKLVCPSGFGKESPPPGPPAWQLFDMANDPYEHKNVGMAHPDVADDLAKQYDRWFADVSSTRPDNYAPPRIIVGSPKEDLTVLTRQDWRGAGWSPDDNGHWLIAVAADKVFNVTVRFAPAEVESTVELTIGDRKRSVTAPSRQADVTVPSIPLPAGPTQVGATITQGGRQRGPRFIELSAD